MKTRYLGNNRYIRVAYVCAGRALDRGGRVICEAQTLFCYARQTVKKKSSSHCVGIGKATKALKETKEEAVEIAFERHLWSKTFRKKVGKKSVIKPSFPHDEDIEFLGAVDIQQRVEIRTA
ncbi:unnamed protein product [Pieris brassicae]|uniref:Uncharacterized protein n=1 Tax=Pieris brassicae TaxID=7116 RepID=A0A9P0X2V3_PIEBR|nr:unnamed protein product [Pieris brassicae]